MSRRAATIVALEGAWSAAGCDGAQSTLAPVGPAAERIADLWWVMLAIATAVCLLVVALLAIAVWRRRASDSDVAPETERRATRWVVFGGFVAPTVILVALFVYTLDVLGALAPRARADERPGDLTIEVVGWRWWWEVNYLSPDPSQRFATANEIHIPVGRRVQVRLIGADVIHSFWVPRLHGKIDNIPGKPNALWMQASEPGVYRGQCAEYCGLQHANMALLVIAQAPEEFAAWAEVQRQPAPPPADALASHGRDVFTRACATCHTVRGISATIAPGPQLLVAPDLTHLASRRTLAAGAIPNTKGHLGGWIANPQQVKPGNLMPQVPLAPEEFHALLHYLQSLR